MARVPSQRMASLRSDALQLAVNFHNDTVPTIAEIWEKAAFFEAFILTGADGTRDAYAPRDSEPTQLRVVN